MHGDLLLVCEEQLYKGQHLSFLLYHILSKEIVVIMINVNLNFINKTQTRAEAY